ncbi:MAG: DUF418 domain-containing protein [Bacteroidia bacterium]
MESKRIVGFDLARGLAILGMIIVNFRIVLSKESDDIFYNIMDVFSGKAAALFVVLAGLGMSLMYQSALKKSEELAIKKVKTDLFKRAAFLFVIGLSFYFIWPADILHYYGVFLSVGALFLPVRQKILITISLVIVLSYPVLLLIFDYSSGWIFETYEYTDFFTINGFFRNLMFNGFHPVIPWFAFLLIGIWIGRFDFSNHSTLKKTALASIFIYLITKLASMAILTIEPSTLGMTFDDMRALFSTEPMPPNPFYMFCAAALAVFVIVVCVKLAQIFCNNVIVRSLVNFGQLALSNYFFHVIIGMGVVEIFINNAVPLLDSSFVFFYALAYGFVFIVFSYLWRKRFKRGPLEMLMRKVTG